MNLATRAFACTTAVIFSAAAAAAPVVEIDSEHMAAMGVTTALTVAHDAPLYHSVLTQRPRDFTRLTLAHLNAGTSFEALAGSPFGVTLPCQISGTLTVSMKQTRLLRLTWDGCQFPLHGTPVTLDGPGEVLLLADSLEPTTVGSIRFGNADADLVQAGGQDFPEYSYRETYRRNLRISGLIPLAEFYYPGTETPFAYGIKGFVDETVEYTYPNGEQEPLTYNYLHTAENLEYAGVNRVGENWDSFYEELRVLFGKYTFQRDEGPFYGVSFESEDYTGLRVTRLQNPDFTVETTIDGRVNRVYNRWSGQGCVNGTYAFKTRSPMKQELNGWNRFGAGELLINESTRARFFGAENTPPELPAPVNGMLLNLDVKNVGTFNYDAPSANDAVRPIARCM